MKTLQFLLLQSVILFEVSSSSPTGKIEGKKIPSLRDLSEVTTDLSNGAVLAVSIATPTLDDDGVATAIVDDTSSTAENKYYYAHDETVYVSGSASVGKGIPDVAYIYIIGSSESTAADDGACGSRLECIQSFVQTLHDAATTDGSAKLAAVIDFDYSASVTADLTVPVDPQIDQAILQSEPSGDSNCADALKKAIELIESPANTAGTTVVVFVGDGLCTTDFVNPYTGIDVTEELAATGAIVHAIAVGDSISCGYSFNAQGVDNHLNEIPQNGGQCFTLADSNELPNLTPDIIGTGILLLEVQLNDVGRNVTGDYNGIPDFSLTQDLPAAGPVQIGFNTSLVGLSPGLYQVCVRVSGVDSLDGVTKIADCHDFEVLRNSIDDEMEAWAIFMVILAVIAGVVVGLGVGAALMHIVVAEALNTTSPAAKGDDNIHQNNLELQENREFS